MATEVLHVPEEKLMQVIHVIRTGLTYALDKAVEPEVRAALKKWCDEEEAYARECGLDQLE